MPCLGYHRHGQGNEISPTSWSQTNPAPCHWAPSFRHSPLKSVHRHPHAVSRKHLKICTSRTTADISRQHFCLPQPARPASVAAKGWADPGTGASCCRWVQLHGPTTGCLRGSCLSAQSAFLEKANLQQKSR